MSGSPVTHRGNGVVHLLANLRARRHARELGLAATVGDRLVVPSHHNGIPDRVGEIIEVSHADGAPPYLVRWLDDGRFGLVYPPDGARVERHARRPARRVA